MKNYRTKDLSINDIKVDQKNPRFQEVHSQKDAINTMVEKQGKKLIAMADHISNHGLDPSKLVVVFKENGDYVCGEGNRRVTTLKCIHDLSLVSNARTRKLFGKFSKTSFPSKIPCVICKDRDEANVWIALNHNGPGDGEGAIPWGSAERDRFNQTESIGTQILDRFVNNSKKQGQYNKTTVDRFFKFSPIKKALGIVVDKKGVIDFSKIDRANTRTLARALEGVSVGKVYTADDAKNFYDQNITAPSKKAQAPTPARKTVIPKTFKLSISDQKANNVYHELQILVVKNFPNASAILLRTFLELTVGFYSKKRGITHGQKAILRQRFRACYLDMKLEKSQEQVLDAICSDQSHPAHTSILNSYTHNPNHHPDHDSVKTAFDNLQVFFERAYV